MKETWEKAQIAKNYIEKKYKKHFEEEKKKKDWWQALVQRLKGYKLTKEEREVIKKEILHKESKMHRIQRKKLTANDFIPLTIIGRGAFGEVRLCKIKETSELVAVKKLKKSEMIYKNQIGHVKAERDILVQSQNDWIVGLHFSFKDEKYLYLVMEYLCGGDLMTLLMKRDILTEEEAKFYMAEMVLAVDSVHKMNYIHRDLKPDNILIDKQGHIKLSDFGLCAKYEIKPKIDYYLEMNKNKVKGKQNRRKLLHSTVGTPDYIAPEVFARQGYNETVDWWSIGVILFEMMVGFPPFFSEDPSDIYNKILNWEDHFSIPPEANLSYWSIDLIRKLIAHPKERLGINGVQEIKAHPFFAGINWKKIRKMSAPYPPNLKGKEDTKYFDKFEEEDPWWIPAYNNKNGQRKFNKMADYQFCGFTMKKKIEREKTKLTERMIEEIEQNIKNNRSFYKPKINNSFSKTNISSHSFKKKPHRKREKLEYSHHYYRKKGKGILNSHTNLSYLLRRNGSKRKKKEGDYKNKLNNFLIKNFAAKRLKSGASSIKRKLRGGKGNGSPKSNLNNLIFSSKLKTKKNTGSQRSKNKQKNNPKYLLTENSTFYQKLKNKTFHLKYTLDKKKGSPSQLRSKIKIMEAKKNGVKLSNRTRNKI